MSASRTGTDTQRLRSLKVLELRERSWTARLGISRIEHRSGGRACMILSQSEPAFRVWMGSSCSPADVHRVAVSEVDPLDGLLAAPSLRDRLADRLDPVEQIRALTGQILRGSPHHRARAPPSRRPPERSGPVPSATGSHWSP